MSLYIVNSIKDKEKRLKLCLSELSCKNGRSWSKYDILAVYLVCNITKRQSKGVP